MTNFKRYFITIPIAKEGNLKLGGGYKTIGAELTLQEYNALGVFSSRVKIVEGKTEDIKPYLKDNPDLDFNEVKTPATLSNSVTESEKAEDLDSLRAEYKELIGNKVPRKFYKNADWIETKITEAKAEVKEESNSETESEEEEIKIAE